MRLQSWQDAGRATGRARRGFTLIELLAVIVILSILAYFLVTNVFAARETVEIQATRATLAQVAAAIGEYADETGDWPPSDFPEAWGPAPGKVNLGGEALYLVLCAEGRPGEGRLDQDPSNTDGDATGVRIEGHQSLQVFELADAWGNPIAYFHHRDYDRKDVYVTFDEDAGGDTESVVQARRNDKTGRWQAPRGFQLISAGPNGRFDVPGSEEDDDVTYFGG
jgi:prepilin-type N-terminal cleavage/methylation domain-containing protein